MSLRTSAAPLALVLLAGAASHVLAQGDVKPRPWNPAEMRAQAAADSARAANAPPVPAPPPEPRERVLPTESGITRSLDLFYEPSVPDSILPLVPVYRAVHIDGTGSVYLGALRQDLPIRPYPVALQGAVLRAAVDGETGQTHAAVMVMVPWFGAITPRPRTGIWLGVHVDNGPEQDWKLECTPGPNLYIPGQRPLPVSNPGLVVVPLPAGPHTLTVRLKKMETPYALVQIGQPRLTPLAVERR